MKKLAARRPLLGWIPVAAISVVMMGGCESAGGLGGLLGAASARDLLSAEVRASAESYLSGLADATAALSSVNGYGDLLSLIDELEPHLARARAAYTQLSALPPETRSAVLDAFGSELTRTNGAFTSQLDALAGRFGLPSGLTELVSNVELFTG